MKKEDYKYGFYVHERERERIKPMACAATICAQNIFEIETNDGEKKAAAAAADTTTNENLNRILWRPSEWEMGVRL